MATVKKAERVLRLLQLLVAVGSDAAERSGRDIHDDDLDDLKALTHSEDALDYIHLGLELREAAEPVRLGFRDRVFNWIERLR